MKCILGLALYGPRAASHRYRLGQYVPGLAQSGIDLQIHSLLDDTYLLSRFAGRPAPLKTTLRSAWRRLATLMQRGDYDGAILHCELFPLIPGWVEHSLLPKPYIYDFDDAFFLKYRQGHLRIFRTLLGNKFDQVIAGASAVTAGNAFLASYARSLNRNTVFFPTVVDTERFRPTGQAPRNVFTLGWVGSPSTAPYLDALVEPLMRLGREAPLRLVVIGGKAPIIKDVMVEEVPWDDETEVGHINRFDVGLMPLPDDDWARGKCAFKLIQYMACGVPVVASRIGANIDVVTPSCGFLVDGADGWCAALRVLRDDLQRRAQMGEAARARITTEYSLARNLPVLIGVIDGMLEKGGVSGAGRGFE